MIRSEGLDHWFAADNVNNPNGKSSRKIADHANGLLSAPRSRPPRNWCIGRLAVFGEIVSHGLHSMNDHRVSNQYAA
jgi:hypothetical protein